MKRFAGGLLMAALLTGGVAADEQATWFMPAPRERSASAEALWEAAAGEPLVKRLLAAGWKREPGAEVLRRDGIRLVVERSSAVAEGEREVNLGDTTARLDTREGRMAFPYLGFQLRAEPKGAIESLASELGGDRGLTETLGESVKGRAIVAHRLGEGDETVIFFGAFHGDEPESTELCEKLLEHLREHPELIADRSVIIVPAVNPDGLDADSRLNANGVDLNRNFPTSNWSSEGKGGDYWGGTAASSEPETKVVVELLGRFKPDRIISIHCPYKCVNYDGPAEKLAAIMAEENGYEVKPSIGYPTPGSFGTYAGIEGEIPTITLELPPTGEEDVWTDNRDALVRALRGK